MPPIETADRHQKAVLWRARDGRFDSDGQVILEYPVQIQVRWEEVTGEIVQSLTGTYQVDAKVVVGYDVPVGSVLWKGSLKELPSPSSRITDLKQVVSFRKTPDLKRRHFRRVVKVARYSDTVPLVENS